MPLKPSFTQHRITRSLAGHGQRSFPFIPGLLLMALALIVVFAPKLLLGAIALILFMLGAFLCFVAWKFMQFRQHLSRLAKDLEGKIQVQAFHVQNGDIEVTERDSKKVIFH
jgi:hypothetical protein